MYCKHLILLWSAWLCLSGCQSLIKNHLLGAESYPFSPESLASIVKEFDIETRQFCATESECASYLFAPAKPLSEKLSQNLDMDFTGQRFQSSLALQRAELAPFEGNVVLLHGFRGSKEWMTISASYFQFLGFDVYMPDLLGHGDSRTEKGFGVKDADFLQGFIRSQIDTDKPLLIVGNSMGALAAVILANRLPVDGLLLQAPMIRFDRAVPAYFTDRAPWYQTFIPEQSLQRGASDALQENEIDVSAADITTYFETMQTPQLIFASTTDSVAPYATYQAFESEYIEVAKIENRSHAYMTVIGQPEHQVILKWLVRWQTFAK